MPNGPVTLDDVAAKAGVSRWTVAAAMRGRGRVNAATAQRLKQLAAEMGYDPALTQAGRSLAEARHGRQARNHLVAIAIPVVTIDLPYYAQLLRGAMEALAQGGSAGVLTDVWRSMHDGIADEARFGAALVRGRVDAAIIHPTNQEAVERLMGGWRQGRFGDRPVVTLIRHQAGLPCAGIDHTAATVAALRLLAALGHRRIGFLAWEGEPDLAGEQARFLAACMATAGLDPLRLGRPLALPQAWMSPRNAPHRPDAPGAVDAEVESRLIAWLRADPVTALFVPNDPGALHVLAALRKAGVRVPEDLSVIGCDGTDDLADGGPTRFLATIQPDLVGVGAAAARLALAMVDGAAGSDSVIASEFLPGRSIASASSSR